MTNSRISRIEERKTKKKLVLTVAGIIVVIVLILTAGIPLIIGASVFIGNLSTGEPFAGTADTLAPFPPSLSPIPVATNQSLITIEGYAESESTLKLFVNGDKVKEVILGQDGSFVFEDIVLESGENTIYATATDAADNESAGSQTLTITFLKSAPELSVSTPNDGQTFSRKEQEITISGKTDPGVNISINERFVSVSDDGSFSFPFRLSDGENGIIIVATDQAGNETKKEIKVMYAP